VNNTETSIILVFSCFQFMNY